MIICKVKQDSEKWRKLRIGKVTGTRLSKVFASDNLSLIDELIAETVTQQQEYIFVNDEMQRGKDLEPYAKELYQSITKNIVSEIGFCISDEFKLLGLSPDGLIKNGRKFIGAIEIKCPKTKTHVTYVRQDKIPNDYKYQVYNYFIVCETLQWLDFVSYDPRFKPKEIFIKRIHREEIQDEIESCKSKLKVFFEKYHKYFSEVVF